jgi:CarD family transcriptional regulator
VASHRHAAPAPRHHSTSKSSRVKSVKKSSVPKQAARAPSQVKSKLKPDAKAARTTPAALKVKQTSVRGAAKATARPVAKKSAPPHPDRPAKSARSAAAVAAETHSAPDGTAPDSAAGEAVAIVVVTTETVVLTEVAEVPSEPEALAEPEAPESPEEPEVAVGPEPPRRAFTSATPRNFGNAAGGASPTAAAGGPTASMRPNMGLPPRPPAPAEIFIEGDHVVYPTHGVGKVERIVTETIAGYQLELIHITFEENRMTLRVPVEKARTAGLRKLASRQLFDAALATLKGRARIKRTMWSRRAQEYEAKINSGDPLAIAEVVRDLHRNAGQPDQSFSERQIYEAAMDRLAAELAALDKTDKATAADKLVAFLKATIAAAH